EWCGNNFGSVKNCFKALDSDRSGSVTLPELKRACHKLKWLGCVKTLFESLDIDGDSRSRRDASTGKRALTLDEISFLDTWLVEPGAEEMEAESKTAELMAQQVIKAGQRTPKKSGWDEKDVKHILPLSPSKAKRAASPSKEQGEKLPPARPDSQGSCPSTQAGALQSRPSTQQGSRPSTQQGSRPSTQQGGSRSSTRSDSRPALRQFGGQDWEGFQRSAVDHHQHVRSAKGLARSNSSPAAQRRLPNV
ncbi:unnamed protein product, partial [Polarella glacialis]